MFASLSYFGRVVADMSNQNWENTGPYILGVGNYRYADYALTCPMLIADLLCCLRAPYKVTGALVVHALLLSGVIANFYFGRNFPMGGRGPAIAWFLFGTYWYLVAFIGLTYIVKVQYTKLAQLAENTDAKKALLPLRVAIVTIFSLWICYPIIWIIGDQGAGLISFSGVECIHAFCDIVAKCAPSLSICAPHEPHPPRAQIFPAHNSLAALESNEARWYGRIHERPRARIPSRSARADSMK